MLDAQPWCGCGGTWHPPFVCPFGSFFGQIYNPDTITRGSWFVDSPVSPTPRPHPPPPITPVWLPACLTRCCLTQSLLPVPRPLACWPGPGRTLHCGPCATTPVPGGCSPSFGRCLSWPQPRLCCLVCAWWPFQCKVAPLSWGAMQATLRVPFSPVCPSYPLVPKPG